jgi:hypothetical protein
MLRQEEEWKDRKEMIKDGRDSRRSRSYGIKTKAEECCVKCFSSSCMEGKGGWMCLETDWVCRLFK